MQADRVKTMKQLLTLLLATLLTSGCGTMNPRDFSDSSQRLDLFDYFQGHTLAWGLFEDRFGKLRRQFRVDISGTVDGDTLVLEEDFLYADGERQQRTWTITRNSDDTYTGRAADVVGEAHGETAGNALHWTYLMDLQIGDRQLRVAFDDWMFLQPDGVLLNRARVSKFGLEIGSVTLAFMKPVQAQPVAVAASR
jgi:uncharacterized protein YceK